MRAYLLVSLVLSCSPLLAQTTTRAVAPGATNILDCVRSLRDQNGGGCIEASSAATFGLLFPYPGTNNTFDAAGGAVVGGGEDNAAGLRATVGGGISNDASGVRATVGGGGYNTASGVRATIGGGDGNDVSGDWATIGGGDGNDVSGDWATIGGGINSIASEAHATVSGGADNTASGNSATVGGGEFNVASGARATVGGGLANGASGAYATVGGGFYNTASGSYATVSGGTYNTASGDTSFAAGRRAKAVHDGAFVWGDQTNVDKSSSAAQQFNVYASGGTRIFSNSAGTAGVTLAAGGGSWTSVSDKNAKENFEVVDAREVLELVASMPISTWNYKAQDASIRHMGPMAQDFYAAFELGLGDKSIDTIDPDGVALAAIQGLKAEKDAEIAALRSEKDAEIAALLERVEKLESSLASD